MEMKSVATAKQELPDAGLVRFHDPESGTDVDVVELVDVGLDRRQRALRQVS